MWKFNGNYVGTFNHAIFNLKTQEANLTLSGINGTFTYNPRIRKTVSNITLAEVTLVPVKALNNEALIKLNNVHLQTDYSSKNFLWLGTREFDIATLNVHLPENLSINANNINFKLQQNENNKKIDIQLIYKMGNISGKAFKANSINFDLAITGLDSKALRNLFEKVSNKETLVLQNQKEKAQQFMPLVLKLAAQGLTIDLKSLQFNTAEGAFNLNANASIPKHDSAEDIKPILQNTKASAELRIPQNWLMKQLVAFYQRKIASQNQIQGYSADEAATHMLNHWIINNYFVVSNGVLVTKISFTNGKLLVNGKPPILTPPPQLQPKAQVPPQDQGSDDTDSTLQSQPQQDNNDDSNNSTSVPDDGQPSLPQTVPPQPPVNNTPNNG